MTKLILLSLLLASCATPKPTYKPDPVHKFKTVQERIMECYETLKRLGEDGKVAGDFCLKLWGKNER